MERKKVDLEFIAEIIYFGGLPHKPTVEQYNLQFRRGKGYEDVRKAVSKAMKRGQYKTEYEIEWLALYLGSVFKLYPLTP